MKTLVNIPVTYKTRVVIAGGGFAGLKLARSLPAKYFQVILIDKNNYHQFQPLLYQVATSGLEPSSISFPLRKIFQRKKHIHFRMAELLSVDIKAKEVYTSMGKLAYDHLVLACGTDTNFFGNAHIEQHAIPMKSTAEALWLRNTLLSHFEKAINTTDREELKSLMRIIIVGGGPTGVELSGAIAEMKKYVLPKDYPELDFSQMEISLFEGSPDLLGGMTKESAEKAKEYLQKLGIKVNVNVFVKDYDGEIATLSNGKTLKTKMLLWAAGVYVKPLPGFGMEVYGTSGRIIVDAYNRVKKVTDIFAIGDMALMQTEEYPHGHPQVAQPAIQQARMLAQNLLNLKKNNPLKPFLYEDKGSLATIGRNLAVADLPMFRFSGFFAWLLWLFVHLMSILGSKNKLFVFINWAWNYLTYDQSLRLIIRPRNKPME